MNEMELVDLILHEPDVVDVVIERKESYAYVATESGGNGFETVKTEWLEIRMYKKRSVVEKVEDTSNERPPENPFGCEKS